MKKIVPFIALLLQAGVGYCQQGSGLVTDSMPKSNMAGGQSMTIMSNAQHPRKTNNEVTPRWTFDANYRYGALDQTIQTYDLSKAYSGSLSNTSQYTNPKYSNKNSLGGDVSINYFFNKKHTLGVGIGAMYMQHSGTLMMDGFKADYQDKDGQSRVYRQIIRSNGPLSEDVTITNVNIPVMLKFKNQFRKSFGIWGDIGGLIGIYNNTKTNRNDGTFDYEAIYRLAAESPNAVVSGFDNSQNGDPQHSLLLTQQFYHDANPGRDAVAYLDDQHNSANHFNVGLDKSIAQGQNRPENHYSKLSYGGIVQGGVSWAITYRLAFNLGGYVMYQHNEDENHDQNHITDRIVTEGNGTAANYFGMSSIIKKSDYTTYGAMAGIRIYLGGKGRDTDGDGYTDDVDECKLDWGPINGCPDNDGDGIKNAEDGCPDEYGPALTNGCPDTDGDGFADKLDSCRDVPGNVQGCPIEYWKDHGAKEVALINQNGLVMAPHIVLETDVLRFATGKATIEAEATKVLDQAAATLKSNPKIIIHISGYTDDVGSYANNLMLSLARARAAKAYLVSNGTPDNRIIIAGLANDNPVSANDNDDNRAKNRRIELKLLLPVE